MKLFITGCVVLVFGVLSVNGFIFHFGPCPSPDVVHNFNVTRYMGTWYVQLRYRNIGQIMLGKCGWSVYKFNGRNITDMDFNVGNYYLDLYERDRSGKYQFGEGMANHYLKNSRDAKYVLEGRFDEYAGFTRGLSEKDYWVLDTDYEGYSIVWSCEEDMYLGTQRMRVMTRDKRVPDEYLQNMRQKVRDRGLNPDYLRRVGQNYCD